MSMTFIRSLRHVRFADAVFARGAFGVRARNTRCAFHGSHQALKVPMIPFGSSSVTRMNSAPSMNSQYGASAPEVKKVLA